MQNQMPPDYPPFISTKSGPLFLEFQTYESPEAFDRDAGEPHACFMYGHRWLLHRETLPRFDKAFVEWVENLTGMKRRVDKKRTEKRKSEASNPGKITPLKERWLSYIEWVFVNVDKETQEKIQEEALRVSRSMRISSAPAASSSPVEPLFLKRAASWLEQPLDWINEKLSGYLALVPDFPLVRDENDKPVLESLARLMRDYTQKQLALED